MTYNKDQWIESIEGRLQILRPHLTRRVLEAMSNAAWRSDGRGSHQGCECHVGRP